MFRVKIRNKIFLTSLLALSLSACSLSSNKNSDEEPNHSWLSKINYKNTGSEEASIATLAYSQGNFIKAEKHISKSLQENPRQPQALMVGALTYEKLGRLNRARQYYEDLIIVGGDKTSILGSESGEPEKMSEIARKRLNRIEQIQSEMIIQNTDGTKGFNISKDASNLASKSALEEALFVREEKNIYITKATAEANVKAVELLFVDGEKNIISRFLIMKELAEKDLVTKEEFINAREANVGGLLPMTKKAPSVGIDSPVPSADVIIGRIDALKLSVEERAITYAEFSSERDMIVDAILPKNPRNRVKNKAPSREILEAAKDLRKLEVIYSLDLITNSEKKAEENAINNYVKTTGGRNAVYNKPDAKKNIENLQEIPTVKLATDQAPAVVPAPLEKKVEIKGTMREYPVDPNVTSPFNK